MQGDDLPTSTAEALARGRQTVLSRANQLIGALDPTPLAEGSEAVRAVVGLLMTTLEELKVAEEELREQNVRLTERRLGEERQLQHYRELFRHLPVPAIITDIYATIVECNQAAAELLSRDARYLERKPLAALLHSSYRDEFRRQVTRMQEMDGPRRWRIVLNRTGDLPVTVGATTRLIPGLGTSGSGVLCWLLEPVATDN